MEDDRHAAPVLGKIGLAMARIASLFALAGALVVLIFSILDNPISVQNVLITGVCAASFAALRDRSWGRMLAVLGLFASTLLLALSAAGGTGPVATKEQVFAGLCFVLGAVLLAGHALDRFSRKGEKH